jgi:hypothetical protein
MVEKTPEQLLEEARIREQDLKIQQEVADTLEEQAKLQKEILASRKEQMRILFELGLASKDQYEQALRAAKEEEKTLSAKLDLVQQTNKELEKQLEIQQRQGKAVEGFFNSWRGGLTESIFETGIQLKDIGKSLKENVTLTNLGGMAATAMLQSTALAVATLDNSIADLAKATGTGREYQDLVMDSARGAGALGVGIRNSAQAIQALNNGMSSFRGLNTSVQESVTQTVASLVALGVSGEDAAFSMDFATRTMGMGAEQAAQLTDDLGKFATEIGKSPAQTISELKSSAPQLAAYGKNAVNVFKGLQVQSKKLGIEMNTLLGITAQFDTFEGAAAAAGKLNSLLGGQFLDSMELLSAETEAQRVAMLQNSLQMSGKSFDSMSKFEKMAVANAAGISDMSVANNLFSESSRAAAEATMIGSMTQEEYNKKKQESQSITEKMTILMEQFAVAASPIVNAINGAITTVLEWNDTLGGYLIPIVGGAVVVFGLLASTAAAIAPIMTVMGAGAAASLPLVSGGLTSLTPAIPVLGAISLGMLAFGAAMLMVGAAVAIAAPGISIIFTSLGEFLPILSENLLAFGALALGIIGLGFALAKFTLFGTAGALVLAGLATALGYMASEMTNLSEEDSLIKFIKVVDTIEDENVDRLKKVMDQAERYVEIQADVTAAAAATSIADSVGKLLELVAGSESAAAERNKKEVVLKLDNREFGRAVVNVLDGKMKLNTL